MTRKLRTSVAMQNSFLAAVHSVGPRRSVRSADMQPGVQKVWAICEVTGGGKKVFGAAIEFSEDVDPASLALDSFEAYVAVRPGRKGPGGPPGGGPPGAQRGPRPMAADEEESSPRQIVSIYTSAEPELVPSKNSAAGPFVIVEFTFDPKLSSSTTDGDVVTVIQTKTVKAANGDDFQPASTPYTNDGPRGPSSVIRGVDDWEQSHWWWDDSRAAWLEYSIYLPKSFLQPGGEDKEYPLVLAITHSGTSYDGTCLETLTDNNIASVWSLPEEQERNECVVITPRYERTTLNDYWEHTYDVENTHRLVLSLMKNTWDYGNPNKPDRADKVLKIDRTRVYATGWSMGAMTSLWLMAKHPEIYAAGLIIAGQQRPKDLVDLAHQNLLIITGTTDDKATPWNEKCCEEWKKLGGKVTRPTTWLDKNTMFPVEDQKDKLTPQIEGYLAEGSNITYLTFEDVDHMESCRAFFHIRAAKDWLFTHVKQI